MNHVIVGSQNPTKLEAVRLATYELFSTSLDVIGMPAESGVSDQPMSDEEMIQGAQNRARHAAELFPDAEYSIGLEGGMKVLPRGWFNSGWVCVIDVKYGERGFGAAPAHQVPERVKTLMEADELELSDAVTEIYKSDTVNDRDCTAVLTNGILPAAKFYAVGVLAAFGSIDTPRMV